MKKRSIGTRIAQVVMTALCIALAAVIAFHFLSPADESVHVAPPSQAASVNVYAERIEGCEFVKTVRLYGKVEDLNDEIAAVTSTSGYVTGVLKKKGDSVKEGDILGYVDASTAGQSFRSSAVRAKVDGTVMDVLVTEGEYITSGSAFATIAEAPEYFIALDIPERYVYDIGEGSEATLTSSITKSMSIPAHVTYVDRRTESGTNTFSAELRPDSSEGLREGMTVTADLVTRRIPSAFVIPMESMVAMSDGTYVYKVEDGKAVLCQVSLGDNNATSYVVTSGLSEGDLVVTDGTVSDGTPVNILTRSN